MMCSEWNEALPSEITQSKRIEESRKHLPDAARRGGIAETHGWRDICAEFTLARLSGLPHTDEWRGPDLGRTIQLKTTQYGDGKNLLVPLTHLREGNRYVQVEFYEKGDRIAFRLIGYAPYEQVKAIDLWDCNRPDRGDPVHLVRRNALLSCPSLNEWKNWDSTCENSLSLI